MTQSEAELVRALAWMCEQYLKDGDVLDHQFMSAGQDALALLGRRGLVQVSPQGGTWTDAGRTLLNVRD